MHWADEREKPNRREIMEPRRLRLLRGKTHHSTRIPYRYAAINTCLYVLKGRVTYVRHVTAQLVRYRRGSYCHAWATHFFELVLYFDYTSWKNSQRHTDSCKLRYFW